MSTDKYYDYVCLVPISELIKIAPSPFEEFIWFEVNRDYRPLTKEEIQEAIETNKMTNVSFQEAGDQAESRQWHVSRVAYLSKYRNNDPILIEMRPCFHDLVRPEMFDGFHRLAAGIYNGDEYIRACFSGIVGDCDLFNVTKTTEESSDDYWNY